MPLSSSFDNRCPHYRLLAWTALGLLAVGCSGSPSTVEEPATEPAEEQVTNETPAPTADVEADPNAYPSFGIYVPMPEGWLVDPAPPQIGFVARWIADASPDGSWTQFTVNLVPRRGMDPSRAAKAWTKRGYRETDIKLDGATAVRLDFDPPTPPADEGASQVPSPIVIALNSGMLYTVLFLQDDAAPPGLVDEVLGGWRWLDAEPVALHLELGEPISVFDGSGTLRLPKPARLDTTMTSGEMQAYLAFDYTGGQDGWLVSMERIEPPAGEPADRLERAAIDYAKQIESRTGINSLLNFQPLATAPHVMACAPLTGSFPDGQGGTVTRLTAYALWQPAADTLVRLQFVINNEVVTGEEQTAAAVAAIDAVLQSCSGPSGE